MLALIAAALVLAARQPSLDDLATRALSQIDGEIVLPGLRSDVHVVRDTWGVPHIYASSEEDLYFAQGYVAAQDRLWQMEMWRRTAEGKLAEILGPQAIERDRIARLLRYRGAIDDAELTVYHPAARKLMTAFVAGVNRFMMARADSLPIEFVLTGIRPEPWTIETLLLRQITFGDAAAELSLARSVAQHGLAEANRRSNPDPWDDLTVPRGVDVSAIGEAVLASTQTAGRLPPPEILPAYRSTVAGRLFSLPPVFGTLDVIQPGSNNWVVSGAMSTTGKPVIANDPHREVTLPSLRYLVHLNAPGWNVIGATEPPFLGIAIGHNERLGWGLTIVGTDQQDVYVEQLNPANPKEVRWKDGWEPLQVVTEQIQIKGQPARTIELKFSRHGPVFHEDVSRHRAYALRSVLHERGTAPYLAGLRLSQARDCRQFVDEARHWSAPSENLICGDVDGNIAWRASALTPRREGWVGRLPVPGGGDYEWQGFRSDLPREYNPARGFIVTANHNVQPKDYAPPFMFKDADTRFDRITRLQQLLVPGRRYSLDDHQRMQHDALSLGAQADVPRFRGWVSTDARVERARAMLAAWDAVYRKESVEASLYVAWRGASQNSDRLEPTGLEQSLRRGLDRLAELLGSNWNNWRWGRLHARAFPHPLIRRFDLPTVERSGGVDTVAADGASFREILDVSDWDRSLVVNTPGQSGQPGSPYYSNLLQIWADNGYFPLVFSKQAVDAGAAHRLTLRARGAE